MTRRFESFPGSQEHPNTHKEIKMNTKPSFTNKQAQEQLDMFLSHHDQMIECKNAGAKPGELDAIWKAYDEAIQKYLDDHKPEHLFNFQFAWNDPDDKHGVVTVMLTGLGEPWRNKVGDVYCNRKYDSKQYTVEFNWSAWGSQNANVTRKVAAAFLVATEIMEDLEKWANGG